MKEQVLFHVPHSSLYIPEKYKKTALISPHSLEKENLLMCDHRIDELLPDCCNALIFPYSRLYCDVEKFRDETEKMNAYGMGYIYTKASDGRKLFTPTSAHIRKIDKIYEHHHNLLDEAVKNIISSYGKCLIIDFHSFSDEVVNRLFNCYDTPDICIGTMPGYTPRSLAYQLQQYLTELGYTTAFNYPYSGTMVPNFYFGKKDSGVYSIMLEINKRIYLPEH